MFRKSVKISLIAVYLVIIAGAVVRMTGSGMGCPDWPKCFGYYIPPTDETQLLWHPGHEYFKGQVIIVDESLIIANDHFKSGKEFQQTHWTTYDKHDYAEFNATHTWVEYINRLFGALSGLAILVMTILSFRHWKNNKKLVFLSFLSLFLLVFQAWLGATVVYSVLSPIRITIHMVVALLIVGLLIYILKISDHRKSNQIVSKGFRTIILIAVILSLIQVALGTQVRQFIDDQIKIYGYDARENWLANPNLTFYAHRSFSVLVFIVNFALYYINKKRSFGFKRVKWMMLLIILEIATGIAMYYFDFPFLTQALHLVIASLLFGIQFYILMQSFDAKLKPQTQNKAS
ncbi:MAG: COX15/CtaA family protein [Psychroflexus sp.]|nr:COX15/CtaA family protein [Psychroflexus sp.]MDN6309529.1 COX15/CtaA family protein [Psychroflexus sp.]